MDLRQIPDDKPVLIAGPTASGKSALAIEIAEKSGRTIVNADASQVYECWRVVTARPSLADEARTPHRLYGHQPFDADYSAGHWLRDVKGLMETDARPIIVGGTGLYFMALTEGMAEIPPTPEDIRHTGDALSLEQLCAELDTKTARRIDMQNRMRVQRAWEVLRATGRPLADWQDDTPPPFLTLDDCVPLIIENDKDWLEQRIRARFGTMLSTGALDEIEAMRARYEPALPSCKAIGVPELMAYINGTLSLTEAEEQAAISTRRYAKRQRTWFRRRMRDWIKVQVGP